MLQKMKELEATIKTQSQMEIKLRKKNSCKTFETEMQEIQKALQTPFLMQMPSRKNLVLNFGGSHKLEGIGCPLHPETHSFTHQIQKLQDARRKTFTEKQIECTLLQALLQQLKEEHLNRWPVHQQHIVFQELRKEAEKLKQMLDESKLSADEDKYLFNKMAEDYGHLEKQLREENASHSRRVSELVSAKGEERHLEKELTYLMTLLRDSSQRVLKAQDQLMSLQQQKESANRNEHSLQSQLRDAEWRHSSIQLENFKLQTEKTHLVEYVSHLHKQIAEKEREIHCLQSC
uniref:Uncharacterized protein n=1 Tax=Sphaerodactylus townsendi TaxID=933632 RepID=A0ACB8FF17_9SAUR